jgi:hypothetical protein
MNLKKKGTNILIMDFVQEEWESYINANKNGSINDKSTVFTSKTPEKASIPTLPKCDDLYISTTTKVLFLNDKIDINNIFWEIPIIEYWKPICGVIKKQMKIVSHTKDEYELYKNKLQYISYYTEHVIKSIDNPNARRNKFKDERKITVGMSKRDIMNCRGKTKNAFYNCFALIFRFTYKNEFHEIHVKIFNTGKLEIPGILNGELLKIAKLMILSLLRPIKNNIDFVENDEEKNVLINSNFNCGFYIDRDILYNILRNTYNIDTAYDPCSYPGVKCKYYFNNEKEFDYEKQKGVIELNDHSKSYSQILNSVKYTEISFMIFRTGSCLIVGNCTEKILRFVFEFIKNILQNEYEKIVSPNEEQTVKIKQTKIRKKKITISNENYNLYISK